MGFLDWLFGGKTNSVKCQRCGVKISSIREVYRAIEGAGGAVEYATENPTGISQGAFDRITNRRAFECRECGLVWCTGCLLTKAPACPTGGKLCPTCQSTFGNDCKVFNTAALLAPKELREQIKELTAGLSRTGYNDVPEVADFGVEAVSIVEDLVCRAHVEGGPRCDNLVLLLIEMAERGNQDAFNLLKDIAHTQIPVKWAQSDGNPVARANKYLNRKAK